MDNTPMPSLTVHTTVNLKRSLRSAENENASIHQPNEVPHSAKHSIFNELSGKDPEMMNGSSTYMPLPCPTYVLGGNLISYTSEIFTAMEDQGKWIILSSNLPIILFAEFALVSQTCAPSFSNLSPLYFIFPMSTVQSMRRKAASDCTVKDKQLISFAEAINNLIFVAFAGRVQMPLLWDSGTCSESAIWILTWSTWSSLTDGASGSGGPPQCRVHLCTRIICIQIH